MSPITPCTSNTVRPCKIKVIKSSEHLHTYHREVSTSKLMFKTYLVHLFLSHLCFAILSVHELRHVNQSYWIIPYIEQPHKIVMLKKCVKCWKKKATLLSSNVKHFLRKKLALSILNLCLGHMACQSIASFIIICPLGSLTSSKLFLYVDVPALCPNRYMATEARN